MVLSNINPRDDSNWLSQNFQGGGLATNQIIQIQPALVVDPSWWFPEIGLSGYGHHPANDGISPTKTLQLFGDPPMAMESSKSWGAKAPFGPLELRTFVQKLGWRGGQVERGWSSAAWRIQTFGALRTWGSLINKRCCNDVSGFIDYFLCWDFATKYGSVLMNCCFLS